MKKLFLILLLGIVSCTKNELVVENFWEQFVDTSWVSDKSIYLNNKYGESNLCLSVMDASTIYSSYEIVGGRHVKCQMIEAQNKENSSASYFVLQNDRNRFQILIRGNSGEETTAESYITYSKQGESIHIEIRNYQYLSSKIINSKSFKSSLKKTSLNFQQSMGKCL